MPPEQLHSIYLSSVNNVALSGSDDKTLRLWEVGTGACIKIFAGHTGFVYSVCLSLDNRLALSGSRDSTVRLWDTATEQCIRIFEGHTKQVNSVCLSSCNSFAISGSDDGTIRLWDVNAGKCLRIIDTTDNIESLSLSADNRSAISGGHYGTMQLWNINTGECLRTFEGNKWGVKSVKISSDNHFAVSGEDLHEGDNTMRLWEVATGRCLYIFKGHQWGVTSVNISEDNRWALSGSHDRTIRLWDVSSGQCIRTLEGHTSWVNSVCISKDNKLALSGSNDAKMRLWDIDLITQKKQQIRMPYLLSKLTTAEDVINLQANFNESVNDCRIALFNKDWADALNHARKARSVPGFETTPESLEIWNSTGLHCFRKRFRSGWIRRILTTHIEYESMKFVSSDYRLALSTGTNEEDNNAVRLWDVTSGQCIQTFVGHVSWVGDVCLSQDNQLALSGSGDKTVRLWDVTSGNCLHVLNGHADLIDRVCLSLDKRLALSASRDTNIRLWDLTTGHCLRSIGGDRKHGLVHSLCLSSDNHFVWIITEGSLRVLDLITEQCVHALNLEPREVNFLCMGSDNKVSLFSFSIDTEMRLRDALTGQWLQTFTGHTNQVNSVCMSSDNRWVLSGGDDKTMRLWCVESGECLRTFDGHTDSIFLVHLSDDNRWAFSGSRDGTLRIYELDWDFEFREKTNQEVVIRPYLHNFLSMHTPYAGNLPVHRDPTDDEITQALTRKGTPSWTDDDFQKLLYTLACAGYGWLDPLDVLNELKDMAGEINIHFKQDEFTAI